MTCILTLIANRAAITLTSAIIADVRDAAGGGTVTTLSAGEAADVACAAVPDMDRVRAAFAGAPVDAIVTPAEGRRKRLLIADMDSTIIIGETLDELAAFAGLGDRVAAITARAMNGELDFREALRERVGMLKGLDISALERTRDAVRLTPGATELAGTMKAHGAYTALVSGGFTFFTAHVAVLAGFDMHRSNTLLLDGATLSGQVAEPILDRQAKLAALHELIGLRGIAPRDALAVGDGANDLDMLSAAGLGVAFHAKPVVAAAAQARVDHADLRALLFAQGYRADEFVSV